VPLTEVIMENASVVYDQIILDSSVDKYYRCDVDINGSVRPNTECNLILKLYHDNELIRHRVITVLNPSEGIFIPDLVVLDYTLEGLTGGSSIHLTLSALEDSISVAPQEFNVRCKFEEYIPDEPVVEEGMLAPDGSVMIAPDGSPMTAP